MFAVSISQVFNTGYQVIKSFINRITQLFLNIFRKTPERAPDKLNNEVVDLTKEVKPNIFQRQGHLIRQKSLIERHIRTKGLTNQFDTTHIVEKVGDNYVKTHRQNLFKVPTALIEKLAWDMAQILGHEEYFAPTGVIKFDSTSTEMLDGEINKRRFSSLEADCVSYQTDSGTLLKQNLNLLSLEGFDDVFSLILIYGMYDSHNNNILAKNGKPIFFDNPRICPPTNIFLSNCYGHMFPLRLEFIGYDRASKAMTAESRAYILNRVNTTLSKLGTLKNYLNDPFVQTKYEALSTWVDAEKSMNAMEARLTSMKIELESDKSVTYNDLVYAIYPKVKLYTALLLKGMLHTNPNIPLEAALAYVGYKSFAELFDQTDKVETVKIPKIEPDDTLETLYKKIREGSLIDYSKGSLKNDFTYLELSQVLTKDHPKYLLYAALVFQYALGKNSTYSLANLTDHLSEVVITECFVKITTVQKLKIADFNPRDTFEEIFKKTKEGPYREITLKEAQNELLKDCEVNAIEDRHPFSLINDHVRSILGLGMLNYVRSYIINGQPPHINQFLIPGQFVIVHKGAHLPPLTLSQFKQWIEGGALPSLQLEAKKEIDALGCSEVKLLFHNFKNDYLNLIEKDETKYFQRMYGKTFVTYRAYRDLAGKLTVQPISKLTAISKSEPLPQPKLMTHPDCSEIRPSTVPGCYIAVINEVYLPPMYEDELIKWFDTDRAEYHKLKKYKDNGCLALTSDELEEVLDLFNIGNSGLYQIIDTNPVKHVYCENVEGEIFTYEVVERGDNAGYMKNGTWVKLFP